MYFDSRTDTQVSTQQYEVDKLRQSLIIWRS